MAKTLYGLAVSEDVYSLNQPTGRTVTKRNPEGSRVKVWATERHFQAAVFEAIAWEALRRPEFGLLYHIPNEGSHKQPGVMGGVPDLHLPVARGGYHSLYCELKVASGKCSEKQLETMYKLRKEGNFCVVVWDSVSDVFCHLEDYLALSA